MSHREEAPGKTQDTLERLCLVGWPGNASGSPRKSWRKVSGHSVNKDAALAHPSQDITTGLADPTLGPNCPLEKLLGPDTLCGASSPPPSNATLDIVSK
ncbi:hypothetical protein L3Q82_002901 [Scortum barcoo]|uniref:Uncharacterized protein n=1 Tax=Scortum barcoo TaxID=214431 RepID=A0ACB8VUJ5_9TELE|nr:hypothetical protein L3Q82_002901 [Scortum barcoo]